MNKERINDRVREAIQYVLDSHKGITQIRLAEMWGMAPSTVTEIVKERMKASTEVMAFLVFHYGISARWILTGLGEMSQPAEEKQGPHPVPASSYIKDVVALINRKDAEIQKLKARIQQLTEQVDQPEEQLHPQDESSSSSEDESSSPKDARSSSENACSQTHD